MAVIADVKLRVSYGICIGLGSTEIEELTDFLREKRDLVGNPLFVPMAVTRLCIPITAAINLRHNSDLYDIQAAMKIGQHTNGSAVTHTRNLAESASKLAALALSSAGITQLCSTQSRILKFLDEQIASQKTEPRIYDGLCLRSLCGLYKFAKQFLEAEQQHNIFIKEATQAQSQMVYDIPPFIASIFSNVSHRFIVLQHRETTS